MHIHATVMINYIMRLTIIPEVPGGVLKPQKVKLHVALYIHSIVVINYEETKRCAELIFPLGGEGDAHGWISHPLIHKSM